MPWEIADGKPAQQVGVSFYGQDDQHKWRLQDGYGGRWVENAVSGFCRDLLANAMLNLEAAGYPIVLSVHDEVVAEVPESFGSSQRVRGDHVPVARLGGRPSRQGRRLASEALSKIAREDRTARKIVVSLSSTHRQKSSLTAKWQMRPARLAKRHWVGCRAVNQWLIERPTPRRPPPPDIRARSRSLYWLYKNKTVVDVCAIPG